ncbi:phosphatidate cytidylyltransferase [Kocuria rhizophila]|nr:phosphatidate cytidylyltransferase [Kocuria rhizophila]
MSPNKTSGELMGGVALPPRPWGQRCGGSPVHPWQAGVLALVSCLLGLVGGLVMSSLKRDRGVELGRSSQGHGGILDQMTP